MRLISSPRASASAPFFGLRLSVGRASASSASGFSAPRMSVLLPEPEMPVSTVRRPTGMRTSTSFRLCSVAPRTSSQRSAVARSRRWPRSGCRSGLRKQLPVVDAVEVADLGERSLRDDFAALPARAGPEIDDVIGAPHRLLIVLDDDERIPLRLQRLERVEQARIVARVQPDRRLIQYIQDAAQRRAELRREADALRLAAGKRLRGAAEREVIEADFFHEPQALRNLRHDVGRDDPVGAGELERSDPGERGLRRHAGDLVERAALEADVARDFVDARAAALGTRLRLAGVEPFVLPLLVHLELDLRVEPLVDPDLPDLAKALAFRAPAVRRVEGKEPRIELLERVAAAAGSSSRSRRCASRFSHRECARSPCRFRARA